MAVHESDVPSGKCTKHPQRGQQGWGDVLRDHSFVSPCGRDTVLCGEGEFLCMSSGARRMLTVGPAFLARHPRDRNGVSPPCNVVGAWAE